jgi:undecaprenyl-diphosphatase
MNWLEVLILAVIQGVGEFLPISSSGHLVVGMAVLERLGMPIQEKLSLSIILHVGSLAAILIVFQRRIRGLLGADRRLIGLLVVGSLPAAVVGLWLQKYFKTALESPITAGLMFPVTGALLLWTLRIPQGRQICREMTYAQAFYVGLFQALAILPGVSRSGATIVAGLTTGLRRDEAAAFSFLLAIPAIGGAGLLEVRNLLQNASDEVSPAVLSVGGAVSFVVSVAALWWLIRWLKEGRLHWFAWWVLAAGPAVLAWQAWIRL